MELFEFTVPPWELVLRGTVIYLSLVLVVRFILRRDVGSLSTADLLFIVIVADAAQNALAGDYKTISEGAVLLGTLVFWNVALDWLVFYVPAFRIIVEPPPLPLVANGRILRPNLRKEWITVEELQSKLREQQIEDLDEVERVTLERDGELSVIKRKKSSNTLAPKRPARGAS